MIEITDQEQVIPFIVATIQELTGQRAYEIEDEEVFVLKLGHVDPMEIGFNKANHPELTEFRYSAHVALLECIVNYMKEPDCAQLRYWMVQQSISN